MSSKKKDQKNQAKKPSYSAGFPELTKAMVRTMTMADIIREDHERVEAVLIASGIITAAQFKAARAFLKAVGR